MQSLINNAFLVSGGGKKTASNQAFRKEKETLSSEMTRRLQRERARDLEEKKRKFLKRECEEEIKQKRRKKVEPRLQQRS